ncbi:DUF948 domain-containing protein [Geosporobacter ferrireducens]|uniref:DUF948 domain-containing protein n=1 Tax=Geosporobacter ferrireducens TaxID=1424294 RepID=A0A1D8GHA8_9FIRM|nr:DUF948 domain-containing protein [Geosporobacter ferrireducens]AOT70279.1 hypothetical protein Gferi_12150 [Geosporobacter ferrireducens]
MDATIRVGDLATLLLGGALLVLITYGIFLLKNLNDTLKVIRKIVEDNRSNIDEILDKVPGIATNIESISSDLSHDVRAVQGTIDQIVGTTEAAAGALSENTDILSILVGFVQVINIFRDFISGFRRKRKWF